MTKFVIFDDIHFMGVFDTRIDVEKHISTLSEFCERYGGKVNTHNIKVCEYNMHLLKKQYTISPTFTLIKQSIKKHEFNHEKVPDNNNQESDIGLFIPLETIPPPNENTPQDTLIQLQNKINELEEIKKKENENIIDNKETKLQEYLEEKAKLDNLKQELKRDQEKWQEIEKKFEADKKLYFIFKEEISNEQRNEDNIPILFKDTYPIFKQLDDEKKLNNDEEIKSYLELTKYYKNTVFMTSEFDDLFVNN
uniref:Uncharacterized protein n=1 Tax=viral metagenome TaxID=1070528 RepID=A0A6C0M1U4_9ZZZZ